MATSSEPDATTRFWRPVAMVLLILAVCGFGFAKLCGGVFTGMGMGAGMGDYGTGFLRRA
jgi:hypothetical protein